MDGRKFKDVNVIFPENIRDEYRNIAFNNVYAFMNIKWENEEKRIYFVKQEIAASDLTYLEEKISNLVFPSLSSILFIDEAIYTEFCPYGNINTIIGKGCLGVKDIYPIFYQIARGIQVLHNNGIIHKRINPFNILVYPDRRDGDFTMYRAKLCGFIFADVSGKTVTTRKDESVFLARETYKFNVYNERTDLISFGNTMKYVINKWYKDDEGSDCVRALVNECKNGSIRNVVEELENIVKENNGVDYFNTLNESLKERSVRFTFDEDIKEAISNNISSRIAKKIYYKVNPSECNEDEMEEEEDYINYQSALNFIEGEEEEEYEYEEEEEEED